MEVIVGIVGAFIGAIVYKFLLNTWRVFKETWDQQDENYKEEKKESRIKHEESDAEEESHAENVAEIFGRGFFGFFVSLISFKMMPGILVGMGIALFWWKT